MSFKWPDFSAYWQTWKEKIPWLKEGKHAIKKETVVTDAAAAETGTDGTDGGILAFVRGMAHWAMGAVLAVAVFGIGTYIFLFAPGGGADEDERTVYVKIESGMTAADIGEVLAEHNIIKSRTAFWLLAKLKGYESAFHAGSYELRTHMDNSAVFDALRQGAITQVKFTIPEGFGVKEIAERLDKEGIANGKEFVRLAKTFAPYPYMEAHPNIRYRAEGFLFPDTYIIDPDLNETQILQVMAENFDNRLTSAIRDKARDRKLSVYELITLASLVEKEVRYQEDLKPVAQVFLKRLQVGMPLQTDASLQYLMDAPKEDVTYSDTEIDSPYNTYKHMGLPPGPIASPGMAAIEAVLDPSDTDYLYFVADRQGHNHYAHTYDEHLALVAQVR